MQKIKNTKLQLILASGSPRRKELLGWSFFPFEIIVSNIEELSSQLDPELIVMDLATQKADAVFKSLKDKTCLVLGSDTIVVHDEKVLEKPTDRSHAKAMLQKLSGQMHSVYTGVSFKMEDKAHQFFTKTDVHFNEINDLLLEQYLDTKESMDKAGAYGIQGAALGFIGEIQGSYSSVVGLPINRVIQELCEMMETDYEGLYEIFKRD
jgi:septum formation protein